MRPSYRAASSPVADHPRNVPDDVLKLVKANGGVVMVNFFPGFIVPKSAKGLILIYAGVPHDGAPIYVELGE